MIADLIVCYLLDSSALISGLRFARQPTNSHCAPVRPSDRSADPFPPAPTAAQNLVQSAHRVGRVGQCRWRPSVGLDIARRRRFRGPARGQLPRRGCAALSAGAELGGGGGCVGRALFAAPTDRDATASMRVRRRTLPVALQFGLGNNSDEENVEERGGALGRGG